MTGRRDSSGRGGSGRGDSGRDARGGSGREARGAARPERPLIEHLQDYANLMVANLLWLVSSLPLITLPAATAGLTAVTAAWVRNGSRPDVVPVFLGAARRQFGRATLVALTDVLLAAPLVLNLLIVQAAAEPGPLLLAARGVCLAGLVYLAAVNLVLWPSLESGAGLAMLWRRAASAVLLQPLIGLGTLAAVAGVFGLGLLLPRFLFLFVSVAAAAYVGCWGALRIERRLPEHLADLGGRGVGGGGRGGASRTGEHDRTRVRGAEEGIR